MLIKSTLSTLIMFTLTTPVLAQQSVKHISSYKEPEPLERVAPTYPQTAARERREGWTKMSFVIEKDGSISNAVVIESSGSTDFNKKSLSAIKNWKYAPAMENGQPIQQCVNTVKLDFKMGRDAERGISRQFRNQYNKALNALQQKNYDVVQEHLSSIKNNNKMHLTESNLYHSLASNYAKDIGDSVKELYHLNHIAIESSHLKPENVYSILSRVFYLKIQQNHLSSAISTYNKIKDLTIAKPDIAKFDRIIEQVEDLIDSDKDIVVKANLSTKDFWFYQLVRNKFTISNINGNLHKIDVRCANKHHVYTIANNHTWTIPEAWQHCSLMVFGDDQSNFNLIEHPIES